jgi:hypothetical protein
MNLVDFFVSCAHNCNLDKDFQDSILASINNIAPDLSLRTLMIAVIGPLLDLCRRTRGKQSKAAVAYMIYRFVLYYPGIWGEIMEIPKLLEAVVKKLVELSSEREAGLMFPEDTSFLEEETEIIHSRLMFNEEHQELVELLQNVLARQ